MADIEQAVETTAKLYRTRTAAKFLWGDEYPAKMAEWREAIEKVAAARHIDNLKAAMLLSEAAQEKGAAAVSLTIIAAYVEMTEPSKAIAHG